ncbi:unnamed protein product [Phytomonas sp. EM1]|nr:unnamed protein product [Phytomonas sp. EM1]|eukprot:CCW65011.1 unnamed protein product [Phytomonas sp. isolate EM1]
MVQGECNPNVEALRQTANRPMRNLLITGGCGFIGSNFINYFLREYPEMEVWNLDKMEYCAHPKSIEVADLPNYHFVQGDIADATLVLRIFEDHDIDTIVHFAAQAHVENSFHQALLFTTTNVLGTHTLLECARTYGKIGKFIHISTDEVYGERSTPAGEGEVLCPMNPYAATKASAECIARSYHSTYHLPILIVRMNNVYGPYQYPEKLISRFIMLALHGRRLTIQGSGECERSFLHVSDVVRAIALLLQRGVLGEAYNVGSEEPPRSANEIARRVVEAVRGKVESEGDKIESHIVRVEDRVRNDKVYLINSEKIRGLGWRPKVRFDEGFADTVKWYADAMERNFWPSIDVVIGEPEGLKKER